MDYVGKKPLHRSGRRGLGSDRFFLTAVQQVSHRADGHVGVGVNGLNERFQLDSLEAVDHDIEYCFRGV